MYLPQIISRVHNVAYESISTGIDLTAQSVNFSVNSFAFLLNTGIKLSNILKWNVGVSIFLLKCHLGPEI